MSALMPNRTQKSPLPLHCNPSESLLSEKIPTTDGMGIFIAKAQRGKAATKDELPQKIAKIAKKTQHKFLSLRSLRSFAAKILLELHDSSLLQCKGAQRRKETSPSWRLGVLATLR